MNNPIIVLTGPTASGKSAISLEIAKKFDCEIICADSMTVYRGMDIGTDKPKENEMNGIPHHLLDIVNPDEEFNVAIFVEKVKEIIADIQSRGKIPFLVGGSVMYLDAFAYDYQMPEVAPNEALRASLDGKTAEELFKQLCECDPDCEWTVDRNNKRRIIRAIEVCQATGEPLASQKSKKSLPENIFYLAVDKDREELYSQIDKRVDVMFRLGFVDEVRTLHTQYDHNTAMQAAGYRQIIQFLDGEIDLDTAIAKTKQVHRNYAKRQLTWLRRNNDIHWVRNADEAKNLFNKFL
jgi:tRNA dimethylallyltransferase